MRCSERLQDRPGTTDTPQGSAEFLTVLDAFFQKRVHILSPEGMLGEDECAGSLSAVLGDKMSPEISLIQNHFSVYSHTTLNVPDLIRMRVLAQRDSTKS